MLTFFRVNFRIVFFCISLIVILFSTSTRALNCTNQTDYVTLFCAVTVQNDEFGDSGKVWQWGHWSKRGEVFREQLICCLSLSLKCGARRGSWAEDWKTNDKPENCINKIIIIERNIFSGRRWSVRVTKIPIFWPFVAEKDAFRIIILERAYFCNIYSQSPRKMLCSSLKFTKL